MGSGPNPLGQTHNLNQLTQQMGRPHPRATQPERTTQAVIVFSFRCLF